VKIKSQKDFFSGLMFIVVGGTFGWGSYTSYSVGTGARMGPGYFPLLLGSLLALLGVAVLLTSILAKEEQADHEFGSIAWRPLFFILTANLAFGVCLGGLPSIGLQPLGLIIGIFALTIISSYADMHEFNFKGNLILALILSVGSYLAFIVLLQLQIPVWPAYITG
jgi:hypothetical protein